MSVYSVSSGLPEGWCICLTGQAHASFGTPLLYSQVEEWRDLSDHTQDQGHARGADAACLTKTPQENSL